MFKFISQHDQMDCGPACLAMISNHFGKYYSLQYLRDNSFISREGVSVSGIDQAAKKIGFQTFVGKLSIEQLTNNEHLPCVLYWNQNHFVVLYQVKKKIFNKSNTFYIADPGHGKIKVTESTLKKSWISIEKKGIAVFFEPTEEFYKKEGNKKTKLDFQFLKGFLSPFKKEIIQLFFSMLVSSLITLIFPFLTQALIDYGVASKNPHIILIILLAQLFLFIGSTFIELMRNWVLLYIGTRINITIISEFLRKTLRLPIKFFDTKMVGDFHQRIDDHRRIEAFLTSQGLTVLFSLLNFIVFFYVLLFYDLKIVLVYVILTLFAVMWSSLFFKKRKILDYSSFKEKSDNQESIYELINGIQEIKLNGFEDFKRKQWQKIQVSLFRVNSKILKLDQFQYLGFNFINELKNIIVTFIAAREVINGNITLGAMLAIAYIIGQMNSPINQLIAFFRSFQDAQISLERLSEIQDQEEEEKDRSLEFLSTNSYNTSTEGKDIKFENVFFQYNGPLSPVILKNINMIIEKGKTTAIVGSSGSGKTTLMKLLLNFYEPISGEISIEKTNLNKISPKIWRKNCGTVMQDGYIFSDTIERNIATSDEEVDSKKLKEALKIANIEEFVNSLPLKGKTRIGSSGNGLSGGQKQRILIARAVYKNPKYVFFDEATSALDAENEKIIHDNLLNFFKSRTVLIIAHRLSTVKNADRIFVMEKGEIIEEGNHNSLIIKKGVYFSLVKNQLELGS